MSRKEAASKACCRVGALGEYLWSKTEYIMGWDIKVAVAWS